MRLLRRAEIVTKLVSISEDLLVKGAHDITVQADMHLSEVQVADLLGVIVPGYARHQAFGGEFSGDSSFK